MWYSPLTFRRLCRCVRWHITLSNTGSSSTLFKRGADGWVRRRRSMRALVSHSGQQVAGAAPRRDLKIIPSGTIVPMASAQLMHARCARGATRSACGGSSQRGMAPRLSRRAVCIPRAVLAESPTSAVDGCPRGKHWQVRCWPTYSSSSRRSRATGGGHCMLPARAAAQRLPAMPNTHHSIHVNIHSAAALCVVLECPEAQHTQFAPAATAAAAAAGPQVWR